jgi:hypothetical protein
MFYKKSVSDTFLLTKKNKIIIGNKHNTTISKARIFCNNTNLYSYNLFTWFLKKNHKLKYVYFFAKIYLVGLGYKNFVYNKRLYILIGDSNYLVFIIPNELKILCKKNQLFGISLDKQVLNDFFTKLQYLKKMNYYKGKGILKFKNFKFMKLKIGKKQKS